GGSGARCSTRRRSGRALAGNAAERARLAGPVDLSLALLAGVVTRPPPSELQALLHVLSQGRLLNLFSVANKVALAGAMMLVVSYGTIPTFQVGLHFGRVYAAYGGVVIVLSLLWGRPFDGFEPDRRDVLGAAICLAGVFVIFFSP